MKRALAGGLACAIGLALAASGTGANVPGTTYVDKAGGYEITIPKSWQTVPRSVAEVNALIAKLKKSKSTSDLAGYYKQLISTTEERKDLSVYRFQAFDWPASLSQPIPVEVSVGIVAGKHAYTAKTFPPVAGVYANALASNKGSKVTVPKPVTLPVGPAELIEAIIPLGNGVSNGIELYLIPRGKYLYELSFQIEASQLASASLFTTIAKLFKFTS